MPKYDLENLEKTLKNEGKFGGTPVYTRGAGAASLAMFR